MAPERRCYTAECNACNGLIFVGSRMSDNPAVVTDVAREIRALVVAGHAINTVSPDDMRKAKWCDCHVEIVEDTPTSPESR